MGIEGIAIAAAVVLFVAIVLPALTRGRTDAAETPADERFAPELRILPKRSYTHAETTEDRCRIFTAERVMETNTMKERTRIADERTSAIRALARRRSHAKASIAARSALRMRFGIGAALLLPVTIILWILVGSMNLSATVPIVLSLVSVLYAAGFVYLARMWHRMDIEDRLTISEAEDQLDDMNAHRVPSAQKAHRKELQEAHQEELQEPRQKAHQEVRQEISTSGASTAHAKSEDADEPELSLSRNTRSAAADNNSSARAAHHRSAQAQEAASRTPQKLKPSKKPAQPEKIIVPAYTLKPARRAHEDREAVANMRQPMQGTAQQLAQQPTPQSTQQPAQEMMAVRQHAAEAHDDSALRAQVQAQVPYRPKSIGERLGDADIEAAIEVPADTTADNPADTAAAAPVRESRTDVLGVGDTLDSLLARRRA